MLRVAKKHINIKHTAMTLAEILVVVMIIGILGVVMAKAFKRDTTVTKYLYYNIIHTIQNYATKGVKSDLGLGWADAGLCSILSEDFNSIGNIDCDTSDIANNLPNFTTTTGMKFYSLEKPFAQLDENEQPLQTQDQYVIFHVDVDGNESDNVMGSDIFSIEVRKSGIVTPIDVAAKNPDIMATKLVQIYNGAKMTKKVLSSNGKNIFSYDEASCLSTHTATKTLIGTQQDCDSIVLIKDGKPQPATKIDQHIDCTSPKICKILFIKPRLMN